jgi:hypothetical protein
MKKYILIFALLVVPKFALAGIFISEVMYDLEGNDSGREWIEVHNDSDIGIDLSTYFLYENNVAHKIVFISGNQTVPTGEFAIITSNSDKFLEDYPNFSGSLFDSVFALNNTGEELTLLDQDKNKLDLVNYFSELGAKGTGNSLQLSGGVFIPANPTPGVVNADTPENEIDDSDLADNTSSSNTSTNSSSIGDNSTHSSQSSLSDYVPKVKVKTGIGRSRKIIINTPIEFEVFLSNTEDRGKYSWSFGDGGKERGPKVRHIYKFPGQYNVVMNADFKDYNTVSRTKVLVEGSSIELVLDNNLLKVKNVGTSEVNIGNFALKSGEYEYSFSKDTILSAGQSVSKEMFKSGDKIKLYFPNGDIASTIANSPVCLIDKDNYFFAPRESGLCGVEN